MNENPDKLSREGDDAVALHAADILEAGLKRLVKFGGSEENGPSPASPVLLADHRLFASLAARWMHGAEAFCDLLQRETAVLNDALNRKSGEERREAVAVSCKKIVGGCEQLNSHAEEWRAFRLSGAWQLVFKELAAFNAALFEQMATLPEKIRHSVTAHRTPEDGAKVVLELHPPEDFGSRIQAAMAWAAAEVRPSIRPFGAQRRQEPWETFLCAILTFLLFFPLWAVFGVLLFVIFLSVWPVFAIALFAMIWLPAMECVNGRISRMDVAHGAGVTLKMGFGVISFFALVWLFFWLIVKLNLPLDIL